MFDIMSMSIDDPSRLDDQLNQYFWQCLGFPIGHRMYVDRLRAGV